MFIFVLNLYPGGVVPVLWLGSASPWLVLVAFVLVLVKLLSKLRLVVSSLAAKASSHFYLG